jgi:ribosomal protein S18 acetylase RimI-like enzyme
MPAVRRPPLPAQLLPASAVTIDTRRVGYRRLSELVDLHVATLPDDLQDETRDELLRRNKCGLVDLSCSRSLLENSRTVAWLVVEKRPDESWHFFLPEVVSEETSPQRKQSICRSLLTDLHKDFDSNKGWIAQTLICESKNDADLLAECGFPELTQLKVLTRVSTDELPAIPAGNWQFETWTQQNDHLFARVIEKTYEGTLDCPELNGRRTGEQTLTSHTQSGNFDPKLWRVYSQGGEDVGIALLSPHSDSTDDSKEGNTEQRVWEIVYLGVVASHRGRGLAKRMLADMLQVARKDGADEVMLGVDVRNEPAIRLYEQFGFRLFDQRKVHARLRGR